MITSKESAFDVAKRKSMKSHRCWIVFRNKAGELEPARATPEKIKEAMLAVGTKGHFTGYSGDSVPWWIGWRVGLAWLANARAGYL